MSGEQDAEAELERFRRQWREEVTQKRNRETAHGSGSSRLPNAAFQRSLQVSKPAAPTAAGPAPPLGQHEEGRAFHDLPNKEEAMTLDAADKGMERPSAQNEPSTALEHYENAVERESQGKLGDSLALYRKAFKMDDNVHEKYKSKHFPPSAFKSKPAQPNSSNAPVTVPNPAHHSLHGLPTSISSMIDEFSTLAIEGVPAPTDASPTPPCPISELPSEILTHVLFAVANQNVGTFARLALVSKRFAYLTMTEESIWRSVVLSSEQGFGNMHYKFACNVFGEPVTDEDDGHILALEEPATPEEDDAVPKAGPPSMDDIAVHLLKTQYTSSWRQMFRSRPRIRFHGVYISTVNYTRPGSASPTMTTWSSPVHVVTYYRYLRFYRDGTAISLLTTAEPIDVVHVLSRETLPEPQPRDPNAPRKHHHHHHLDRALNSKAPPTSLDKAGSSHGQGSSSSAAQANKTEAPLALPSSQIMKDALRGRWRLSGPGDGTFPTQGEAEGDLHVETEGVAPRYTYKMQFGIGGGQAAGEGAKRGRNNRLVWKGFWSYNRLTDDWGEFGLKNDRAFWFSRVRSYGMGG